MSHNHEDRVADRPAHMCTAYGCPLIGAMATSTTGTNEWWCYVHFGKDVGRYQSITTELRKLDWLAQAITSVRTRNRNPGYGAAFQRIMHDFEQAGRKDLHWTSPESDEQWMVRLERELLKLLEGVLQPAQEQRQLAIQSAKSLNWNRVGFDLPETA